MHARCIGCDGVLFFEVNVAGDAFEGWSKSQIIEDSAGLSKATMCWFWFTYLRKTAVVKVQQAEWRTKKCANGWANGFWPSFSSWLILKYIVEGIWLFCKTTVILQPGHPPSPLVNQSAYYYCPLPLVPLKHREPLETKKFKSPLLKKKLVCTKVSPSLLLPSGRQLVSVWR